MDDGTGFFFLGLLTGAVLFGWLVHAATTSEWERAMISRGFAQYCPKDGELAFKGECDK